MQCTINSTLLLRSLDCQKSNQDQNKFLAVILTWFDNFHVRARCRWKSSKLATKRRGFNHAILLIVHHHIDTPEPIAPEKTWFWKQSHAIRLRGRCFVCGFTTHNSAGLCDALSCCSIAWGVFEIGCFLSKNRACLWRTPFIHAVLPVELLELRRSH